MFEFSIKKDGKEVVVLCYGYIESMFDYALNFGSHIHVFSKKNAKLITTRH